MIFINADIVTIRERMKGKKYLLLKNCRPYTNQVKTIKHNYRLWNPMQGHWSIRPIYSAYLQISYVKNSTHASI